MLTYLSPTEIQSIHQATLRILAEVGIQLDEPDACQLLFEHGAWRSPAGRMCLPAELVESCLGLCPCTVRLSGRGGDLVLGDGRLSVHNLGGAHDVLDPSGRLRPAMCSDVAESTRLLDALPNVTTITPLYTPQDIAAAAMHLEMYAQAARNTLKPINGPGVQTPQDVCLIAEMARIVSGPQAAVSMGVSPVSPLTFPASIVRAVMEIARQAMPLGPLPCPSVGATSPMSLAGSLAQQNAEVLATIVLAELVRPGLPVVYCGRLAVVNMRSGSPVWGNPEIGLMSAATVQIGHSYHLPVNVYGLSDSGYAMDMQSGYERAMNALTPALAGADELSGVGEMSGGTISCNAQLVIDDEIYGMVRRLRQGIKVDAEALAVEVIAHAMDASRNFMAERHTLKYLRAGEVWQGRLGVPELSWENWEAAGRRTVVERAWDDAGKILARHEVPPLEEAQERELTRICRSVVG